MSRAPKLPSFIANQLQGTNVPAGASREFCNLIKAIGESGTNHEETRIIAKECRLLETKLREPNISKKQMKEYLIRLLYCEMLGKDVPFGYIHAVKFTQHTSLLEKRVGYLAVSILLHEDHELIYLLVNTIQRDLQSTNIVEVCMALTAVCKLINAEMIPAVLQYVVNNISHNREIVRKKAVLALHRFYQRSPSSISHLMPKIRRALYDQDPGVMSASLNLFYKMICDDPTKEKDLVPSFVSVLKQVIEHRLPKDFDYHKVPAPWIQIKLLKILALLGKDDRTSSENMYEVLRDCLKRADIQSSAAYAVLYQCVLTCTTIYPSAQLVEMAAKSVGRFLRTENNNLKYLGITALASVVSVNPSYASSHKALVMECLDDPDETLKRKTLDLLCKMTNPANVKVIVEKLLGYLKSTVDTYLRKDLVPRIIELAERYAPDNVWYVETINTLFLTAGDLVESQIAHNLMRLIAEGSEDDDADAELRVYATESYIDVLEEPTLPDLLVQTIAWVVGEYSYLAEDYDQEIVLQLVCELLNRSFDDDAKTKGWIITAIAKMVSQTGLFPNAVRDTLQSWLASSSCDIQQRCAEVLALVQNGALMRDALPLDASCEDLDVDTNLSFLDSIVGSALANGARPYEPMAVRICQEPTEQQSSHVLSTFKFEPYEAPPDPDSLQTTISNMYRGNGDTSLSAMSANQQQSSQKTSYGTEIGATGDQPGSSFAVQAKSTAGLQVKTKRWGKGGDLLKRQQQQLQEVSKKTNNQSNEQDGGGLPVSGTESTHNESVLDTIVSTTSSTTNGDPLTTQPDLSEPGKGKSKQTQDKESKIYHMDEEKRLLADSIFAGADGSQAKTSLSSHPATRKGRVKKSRAAKAGIRKRPNTTSSFDRRDDAGHDDDLLSLDVNLNDPGSVDPVISASMNTNAELPGSQNRSESLLGDLFAPTPRITLHEEAHDTAPPSYDSVVPTTPNFDDLLGDFNTETSTSDISGQLSKESAPADMMDLLSLSTRGLSEKTAMDTLFTDASQPPNDHESYFDLLGDMGRSSMTDSLIEQSNIATPTMLTPDHMTASNQSDAASRTPVTQDANFSIFFDKVRDNHCVHIDITVENKTSHVSSGFVLKLDGSRGMDRIDDDKLESKLGLKLHAGSSETKRTSWVVPSINAGMAVQGTATYLHQGATRTLRFRVALEPADFLRPYILSTEEFGSTWQTKVTSEKSCIIPSASQVADVNNLAKRCDENLHIHVVSTIGDEVIMASKVLSSESQFCLIHCRLDKPTIHVAVRSSSMPFTEAVLQSILAILRS